MRRIRQMKLTDFIDEYVTVVCLKTLSEEILGTDGEFYTIVEGRKMKLPKETAKILQLSGVVKIC